MSAYRGEIGAARLRKDCFIWHRAQPVIRDIAKRYPLCGLITNTVAQPVSAYREEIGAARRRKVSGGHYKACPPEETLATCLKQR